VRWWVAAYKALILQVKVLSYQLPDFRYVVMPQFMQGNLMFIAWCKRPSCLVEETEVGAISGSNEYGSLNVKE